MKNHTFIYTSRLRHIVTTFYYGREVRKINRGSCPAKAVLHCIGHLQSNKYAARIAQIVDEDTGKLYAVITRNIVGKITIHYQDEAICTPLVKHDSTRPVDDKEGMVSRLKQVIAPSVSSSIH